MKTGSNHPRQQPTPNHSAPRRAKIICTIGPACSTESAMRDLLRCGMDVARLNFSHGSHEDHAHNIRRLRRAAEGEGRTVCILEDLQGPKIRTGLLEQRQPVFLKSGSIVTLTPDETPGNESRISTTFPDLAREITPAARILLSDGLIELRVRAICGKDVLCEVIHGGLLGEQKGINLPGVALSIPALTAKDRKDLEFGLQHQIDAIALSFVRTAADVTEVKQIIASHQSDVPVIAKLEKPQAIDHLEEILAVADGVMLARGDLGVEMAPEKVPVIQKHVIRRAAAWRKPVITATQMLESMIENPRPTRAEASDVANAIFDGSDAVMLSAETASGRYPSQSVEIMARIVVEAESSVADLGQIRRRRERPSLTVAETICESIAHAAEDLPMGAIAIFTETGNTARMISKYRPAAPIYAFTHVEPVVQRLNLYWGVHPVRCPQASSAEQMVIMAEQDLVRRGVLKPGDVLGVVAGTRQASGSTNLLRLHTVTEQEAESIVQPASPEVDASCARDPEERGEGDSAAGMREEEETPSAPSSEARPLVR